MKPIAYYCNTTDSIDELIQQHGEFLQHLSQVEKVDLLHNLASILWNLYEPWKVDTQPAEDAFNLVKGQSRKSLIELCTAIITYIQEGERQARLSQAQIKQRAIDIHDEEYGQGDRLTVGERVIDRYKSERLLDQADSSTRGFLYGPIDWTPQPFT